MRSLSQTEAIIVVVIVAIVIFIVVALVWCNWNKNKQVQSPNIPITDPNVAPTTITVNPNCTPNQTTTFKTITDAINSLSNKRLVKTIITVAPGTYNENLSIHSLLTDGRYGLELRGDIRPFVGIGFSHGYVWNRKFSYDPVIGFVQNNIVIGEGIASLNGVSGSNSITVTNSGPSGKNPDFVAAGVVAGDKVYIRHNTGSTRHSSYTVSGVNGNTLTFSTPLTGDANAKGAGLTICPNVHVVANQSMRFLSNLTFKGFWFESTLSNPNGIAIFTNSMIQIHLRGCIVDGADVGYASGVSFFSQGYDDIDPDGFLTGIVFIRQRKTSYQSIISTVFNFGCSFWPEDSAIAIITLIGSFCDFSSSVLLTNNPDAVGVTVVANNFGLSAGAFDIYCSAPGGSSIAISVFSAVIEFFGVVNGLQYGGNIEGGWNIGILALNGTTITIYGLLANLVASTAVVVADSHSNVNILALSVVIGQGLFVGIASNKSSLILNMPGFVSLGKDIGIAAVSGNSTVDFAGGANVSAGVGSSVTPAFVATGQSQVTVHGASAGVITTIGGFPVLVALDEQSTALLTDVVSENGVTVAAGNQSRVVLSNSAINAVGNNVGIVVSNGSVVSSKGAFVNGAVVPVIPSNAFQNPNDAVGSYSSTFLSGLVVYPATVSDVRRNRVVMEDVSADIPLAVLENLDLVRTFVQKQANVSRGHSMSLFA